MLLACGAPEVRREPASGIELVRLPAGRFVMGSPVGEPDRQPDETAHEVRLSTAFWLGRTEVTQGQWERVTGERPSRFSRCGDDCPVETVSALAVERFLVRLRELSGLPFRLPTEAEWEYACRAGRSTAYAFGDGFDPDRANVDDDADDLPPLFDGPIRRGRSPQPVGSYPANDWGLFDLHGNVWEWTSDRSCPYPEVPVTDPRGSCASGLLVIRGGSWHFGPDSARCALRYRHAPDLDGPSLGFRVALDV